MASCSRLFVRGLLCVALLSLPAAASAQAGSADDMWSFGARAGICRAPNEFLIGGHLESPALPQKFLEKLTFRPSIEILHGDGITETMVQLELAMWAPIPRSPWSAYVVAGPGLAFRDGGGGVITFGVGFQHEKGFFGELKYQSGQARVIGGYVFTRK